MVGKVSAWKITVRKKDVAPINRLKKVWGHTWSRWRRGESVQSVLPVPFQGRGLRQPAVEVAVEPLAELIEADPVNVQLELLLQGLEVGA